LDELVVHADVGARLDGVADDFSVFDLPQEIANATDYLFGHQAFLDLWESEDDGYQPRYVSLGFNRAILAELQGIEGDVNQVSVQKKVLAHLIGEYDHE
jgi:hypothetical protein